MTHVFGNELTFFDVAEDSLIESLAQYNGTLKEGEKRLMLTQDGEDFVHEFCGKMDTVYKRDDCDFAFTVCVPQNEMHLVVKSHGLSTFDYHENFVECVRQCKRIELVSVDGVLKVRYILDGCWTEEE